MADQTTIEWTESTWSVITGCTLVSEGCRHCYAAELAATRLKNIPSRKGLARKNAAGEAKFTGEVRFNEQWLDQPLRWTRPRKIFVCAHGDLFHESVPDEWIDRVFAVMALAPQHTFQCLTKRPGRMREYLAATDPAPDAPTMQDRLWRVHYAMRALSPGVTSHVKTWPLPNVWLGTSVEDQATADARIPELLATPAAVRFVSAEPLLGPVDIDPYLSPMTVKRSGTIGPGRLFCPRLDWIIVGGESGRRARPMHPDWARSLRDQCQAAGVAFLFKQWGAWAPDRLALPEDLVDARKSLILAPDGATTSGLMSYPSTSWVTHRVGKKAAGRMLDGRTWDEMPGGGKD